MWESIMKLVKKIKRKNDEPINSKDAAKERLHLVLMQDRANVSADFLELMKQEIIEVIKKYIDVDESAIDVRLTNKENADGTKGAPALYANIPIVNIKDEVRQNSKTNTEKLAEEEPKKQDNKSKQYETKPKTEIKQKTVNEPNAEIRQEEVKETKEKKIEEKAKEAQEQLNVEEPKVKEEIKIQANEINSENKV